MPIKFEDLEFAFMFVSSGPMHSNTAYISRESGETYCDSEYGGMDEIPDEVYEDEQYVEIPHKNELDLGKELVLEFAAGHMPDELDKIQSLFRRKGAYSKYKDWLERNGLLDEWYLFEEKRQEEALRQWCEENDIIIED